MRMGPVLFLLGASAIFGWFAPDLSGRSHDAALVAAKPSQAGHGDTPIRTGSDAYTASSTVLDRESDGHFYANVQVNARSTRFLVDTGASVIALTGADARAIGLTWDAGQVVPVAKGASGVVYGVPVRLEHVEVGTLGARDVGAVIIPEGLEVSLLGQSFLERLKGVHIDGDRMTLGNAD